MDPLQPVKILILEDEPLVGDGLKKHLQELLPHAQFFPVLGSVKKALAWFSKNEIPDLIFSDIQLSDGISFDIFKQYDPPCPVIFTTAFDQYALQAFEVNSVDFILKPVGKPELTKALEKLKKRKDSYRLPDLSMAVEKSKSGTLFMERFLVLLNQVYLPMVEQEVLFFQKEELIFVTRKDQKRFLTEFQSMDDLENKLNPALFFRANRQVIVRFDSIAHFKTSYKGIQIFLKESVHQPIEVSRERSPIFKKWILGL